MIQVWCNNCEAALDEDPALKAGRAATLPRFAVQQCAAEWREKPTEASGFARPMPQTPSKAK
jgi:hypothetical protein